ncbi:MAG: type II toxin-antitoxin system RelE family toxin [Bacteroidota bacterium]
MKAGFRESFLKDLKNLKDKNLKALVNQTIDQIMAVNNMLEIQNLKKLKSQRNSYRIKLGEYRIGLLIEHDRVTFVRFLHKKEIYRYFP